MTLPVNTLSAFGALRRRLDHWHRLLQTRRELSRMPARLLVDIGLSPEMVARTADAPFWQPLGQDLELQPGLDPAPGAGRRARAARPGAAARICRRGEAGGGGLSQSAVRPGLAAAGQG